LEAETGNQVQYLIVRPELYTVLCEESAGSEFDLIEELAGMIVLSSDIQAEEYVLAINIKNVE
jgi:hypothetical protein